MRSRLTLIAMDIFHGAGLTCFNIRDVRNYRKTLREIAAESDEDEKPRVRKRTLPPNPESYEILTRGRIKTAWR